MELENSGIFLDRNMDINIFRKNLPHWEQAGKVQFVTLRLADSMPQTVLKEYTSKKDAFIKLYPQPWNEEIKKLYHKTINAAMENFSDIGYGSCILGNPEIRRISVDSLEHFDNERYIITAYVIMPNHLHALIIPLEDNTVKSIFKSFIRFTTRKINKLTGRSGCLWQSEPFDRIIRNNEHYRNCVDYIRRNPLHLKPEDYSLGGFEFGNRNMVSNRGNVSNRDRASLRDAPSNENTNF